MGQFGDLGANVAAKQTYAKGYIYGLRFTLPEAGTIIDLGIRANCVGAWSPTHRLCLYDDSGNKPNLLRAVTDQVSPDSTWADYALHTAAVTPVELPAGSYYLCLWCGDTYNCLSVARGAATGSTYGGYKAVTYSSTGSPGDIAGSWSSLDIGTLRLFADYTVAESKRIHGIVSGLAGGSIVGGRIIRREAL